MDRLKALQRFYCVCVCVSVCLSVCMRSAYCHPMARLLCKQTNYHGDYMKRVSGHLWPGMWFSGDITSKTVRLVWHQSLDTEDAL